MKQWRFLAAALLIALSMISGPQQVAWGYPSLPIEGFVAVNGVRLQYLDWGGTGPTLIFIHGLGANPRVFDDLAPAFTDRFHVIAYARRGSGNSDAKGPYDVATLTEDLRGLMDALGIAKADLVGLSAGGDEVTEMAARYPQRVGRIVYLDAAYDWTDPDFRAAYRARPFNVFERPATAMQSLDAFRAYETSMWYRGLDDPRRIEAFLRERVVVQPNGSIKERTPKEVLEALYAALWNNKPRNYKQVKSPALAIYAEHAYDVNAADPERRESFRTYERLHWDPFQAKSVQHVQRELANVEVAFVPGTHGCFILTSRQQVVSLMRRFLASDTLRARN